MAATNKLFVAPPHPVEQALKGSRDKPADGAHTPQNDHRGRGHEDRHGAARRPGGRKGQALHRRAVYLALLWVYGLLTPVEELADPTKDTEGLARDSASERVRARKSGALDNDF